jgi:hypothetical protein
MNGLAAMIRLLHAMVVVFVVIVPFMNYPQLLVLHITFCISLLVHWWGNNNMCSLSVLESKLRGLDYTQSFTHSIIAPIYDISQTEWSAVCYVATFALMIISIHQLRQSKNWNDFYRCWIETSRSESPLKDKLVDYIKCFESLFKP